MVRFAFFSAALAAIGVTSPNATAPVGQAAMVGHGPEHSIKNTPELRFYAVRLQTRGWNETAVSVTASPFVNLHVQTDSKDGDRTTMTTSSELPEKTICKTCTKFITVTKTTTVKPEPTCAGKGCEKVCSGKTCESPCSGKTCELPCGKHEDPCSGHDGMPKCCRKKMPEHQGGHGGPGGHGSHGGHGGHQAPPQHPGKYYEPLYDEDGVLVKRPKVTQARDGAIDLWSEEHFTGHRAIYGRTLNKCDTLETLTHNHMGFGKSAHLRWEDTCCQVFAARGCNGEFMMVAGDIPSLAPYDFENKVKSVRCMDTGRCHSFYHNEEWRHHG